MDFAITASRNLGFSWAQVRSQHRQKQKKGRKAFQNSRRFLWEPFVKQLKRVAVFMAKITLAAALASGAYYGYRFMTTTSYFAVSQISFQGNRVLSEKQLLDWTENLRDQNIFLLDLGELTARLREHFWVKDASVKRSFPNRVAITVQERTPYARIQLDRMYILDNYGVLLAEAEPKHGSLPLIVGLPTRQVELGQNVVTQRILQALQTMHYFNRLEFFREDPIDTFRLIGGHRVKFTTRERGIRIFMDLNRLYQSFQNFKIFMKTQEGEEKVFGYLDLSFKDQVVVKHAKENQNGHGSQSS